MMPLDKSRVAAWLLPGLITAAVCLSLLAPAWAASSGKNPMDEPDAYVIQFKKDAKGVKKAYVEGTATPAGVFLKLKNLWVTQPVKLIVMPDNKATAMQVDLYKFHWNPPLRSCNTEDKGGCGFAFTNQGDVFIKITSPSGPAKVYVAAEIGPDATPNMKPVLVPKGGRQ